MNYFPKDKALHFAAGIVVGSLALIASRWIEPGGLPFIAVLAAILAGAAKEAFDWYSNEQAKTEAPSAPPPHDVDLWDAVATSLGGLAVAVVYSLAHRV